MTKSELREFYLGKTPELSQIMPQIEAAISAICECYKNGGRVFICGNGGSSSDSAHIVGEFLKGFLRKRPLPEAEKAALREYGEIGELMAEKLQGSLAAIDLTTQQAIMSAVANDNDPSLMYAQQLWGLGRKGDILIGISTSGNAKNVAAAGIAAKRLGMTTVSLTGSAGGRIGGFFDIAIKAPSSWTPEVQEYHLKIYHLICAAVEFEFFDV